MPYFNTKKEGEETKMDVFGRDALIGDYRLSDHGLMLASFNFEDTYELGMTMETTEEFLGTNPVPTYLGSKYNSKLQPTMTVIQNWHITNKNFFTVNEVREILSRLTGFQGYKKMYVYAPGMLENLYYMVRITDAEVEESAGKIVGIRFPMECDSQFAWIDDEYADVTTANDVILKINNNSDNRYDYLKPIIEITSDNLITDFSITNLSDDNRITHIDEIKAGETITIDSTLSKITSSMNSNYSETFNYIFPRLIYGENEIQVSHPVTIDIKMKLPRKVGFL